MFRIGIVGGKRGFLAENMLKKVLAGAGIESEIDRYSVLGKSYKEEYGDEILDISSKDFKGNVFKKSREKQFSNMDFNFIIVNSLGKGTKELIVSELLNEKTYMIMDVDDYNIKKFLGNVSEKSNIVTFGLGERASISASSIKDESISCCVLKPIVTKSGEIVEEQEFIVRGDFINLEIYSVLSSITTALICGIGVEIFDREGIF